jgi:anti-sigma factor RsiW
MTRPSPEIPPPLRDAADALREQRYSESRAPTPDCLDELAIADFVDGRTSGDERAIVERHLTTCARCRSAVQAVAAMADDAALVATVSKAGKRRWIVTAVASAAAAAAAAIVIMTVPSTRPITMREPAVTSAIAPVALSPVGTATRPTALTWSRVPGAERYRVRVQSADGGVVWSMTSEDTTVTIPDSVRFVAGSQYAWRVEAQTEWRRWVASELVRFVVRAP